jgi:hypothetical protein
VKKVTWFLAVFSTGALLVTIAQGMAVLKGQGDIVSHFHWGLATLVLLLLNNLLAVVHVSRGERLIAVLRARLEKYEGQSLEA